MFSATINDKVAQLTEDWLGPDRVCVDLAQDLKNKTAKNANHLSIDVTGKNRVNVLADIRKFHFYYLVKIYGKQQCKILVFC